MQSMSSDRFDSWLNLCVYLVIKSPRYTGDDFIFLYRFVCRRRRPQILVHAITFEQLFGFLSFLARLLALTRRLPEEIFVDFRHDLDLDFFRSNMEFAISQPKMVRLPWNVKQTHRLNSKASNVAIRFDFGRDLDLEFSRSNMEFPISQPKMVRLPWNKKQTYQLNSRPQMWPIGLTLTFEFEGQTWLWPLTTHMILTHGFSWSNFEIALSQNGRVDSHCRKGVAVVHSWPWPQWWPRSGVWIYQIVTGVTSVVGVPSTHLVRSSCRMFAGRFSDY